MILTHALSPALRSSFITLMILAAILALSGCGGAPITQTPEEALELALGQKFDVVHQEPIPEGLILLYRPEPKALNAALIQKTDEGWKWIFGGGTARPDGVEPIISWSYVLLRDPGQNPPPLSVYYGEVFSEDVAYVEVEEENRPKRRLAVTPNQKYWITVFDRAIDAPTRVRAGTADGRIIYSVISTGKIKMFD